jgi:hypothetical protein
MKLIDITNNFTIAITNEENAVLKELDGITPLDSFEERHRFVIENLVRKSLVSKVNHKGVILVVPNTQEPS